MKIVTNNHTQPLVLEDGTVLAAAGTLGSVKEVAGLGASDERLISGGLISIRDAQLRAVPQAEPEVSKEKK